MEQATVNWAVDQVVEKIDKLLTACPALLQLRVVSALLDIVALRVQIAVVRKRAEATKRLRLTLAPRSKQVWIIKLENGKEIAVFGDYLFRVSEVGTIWEAPPSELVAGVTRILLADENGEEKKVKVVSVIQKPKRKARRR